MAGRRGATGNDGVAQLVKELAGSIGYVEFIYALQNHLSYGKVRNKNGEYVEASLESIAAAVGHSAHTREDFKASIVIRRTKAPIRSRHSPGSSFGVILRMKPRGVQSPRF